MILKSLKMFHISVDCILGQWKLGRCSAKCGANAFRNKTREIVQDATFGGKKCNITRITEKCSLPSCNSKPKTDPSS